jgi:hypothetical protein
MTPSTNLNRIGLRRLFDPKGCSLQSREELSIDLLISERYEARIYLGPKPTHGVQVVTNHPKYLIPGPLVPMGIHEIHMDASKSSHPCKFFLEISVSCLVELTPQDSEVSSAKEQLLQQAEKRASEFQIVIDLIAGIIGLRFHRQFVLEPLDENVFAWVGDNPFTTFAGPSCELLENIALTELGAAEMESFRDRLSRLPKEPREKIGLIFHWLLRAWREHDPVYKFMALFLPLEGLLNLVAVDLAPQKEQNRLIRDIIKTYAGDKKTELLELLDLAMSRLNPTLDERFVLLASEAKLPGWEGDIEAFRRFKRFRNALVHRGDKNIQERLTIGEEDVRTLSDLVERYVNYVLFRDQNVYVSRFRPDIKAQANRPQ